MTKRKAEATLGPAYLADLELLHRYARARHLGEKLSSKSFAKANEDFTDGRFNKAIGRLENTFGVYLLAKRPELGKEVAVDLSWPEDWTRFLEKLKQDAGAVGDAGKDTDGKSSKDWSPTNKDELTLAGEIWGEVASLFAGYAEIAKRALSADAKTGRRPLSQDLSAVLGWLRLERRRLHHIMEAVKRDDPTAVILGRNLDESVFDRADCDIQDMVRNRPGPILIEDDVRPAPEKTTLPMQTRAQRARSQAGLAPAKRLGKRVVAK